MRSKGNGTVKGQFPLPGGTPKLLERTMRILWAKKGNREDILENTGVWKLLATGQKRQEFLIK